MKNHFLSFLFLFFSSSLFIVYFTCSLDSQGRVSASLPSFLSPVLSLLPPSLSPFFSPSSLKPNIVGIEGMVEDCTCAVELVHECIGSLTQILDRLCNTTFFKYFKVNYLKACPFWEDTHVCEAADPSEGEGSCGIQPCSEDEIPPLWRERELERERERKDCEERERSEREKSKVERESEGGGPEWRDRIDKLWIVQDEEEERGRGGESELSYINLKLNPEKYTGYGASTGAAAAARVWKSIYEENCFSSSPSDQCLEERVFYRLISGFHASTTSHICENFEGAKGEKQVNLDMYIWKLGIFPDRVKNIYFTFLFLLRAVHVARHSLMHYNFDTGKGDDVLISPLLSSFFSTELVCSSPFDETSLFTDPNKEQLKDTLRAKFRNISSIMDCVSCETCKVHAKLQILGIGTALRILLDDHEGEKQKGEKYDVELQRNEAIALVNSLLKFAESIEIFLHMSEREAERVLWNVSLVVVSLSLSLSVILFVTLEFVWFILSFGAPKRTKGKAKRK